MHIDWSMGRCTAVIRVKRIGAAHGIIMVLYYISWGGEPLRAVTFLGRNTMELAMRAAARQRKTIVPVVLESLTL